MRVFEHCSILPADVEQVWAFHADPNALRKLSMPPVVMRIKQDERDGLRAGRIAFTMWLGPIPIQWVAQHEPGPIPTSFVDRMVCGPMATWRHEHILEPLPGGTHLIDRITYAHHTGWKGLFTRLLFDGVPLRVLFMYRHWRTRRAVRPDK